MNRSSRRTSGIRCIAACLLVLLIFSGCQGPFDLRTVLGLELETLTVSPDQAYIADNATQMFTAAGGTGPYEWSVYAGPGSIDASGLYTPSAVGVATIQALETATGRYGRAVIRIQDSVLIPPLNLLAGTTSIEAGDSITLFAVGGTPPYSFNILISESVNPDVTSPGGVYTAGDSAGEDVIQVTDSDGATDTVSMTVAVTAATIPEINYQLLSVTADAPGGPGDFITANFSYQNTGSDPGSGDVVWNAYISTTPDLNGVTALADSGTAAPLPGGDSASQMIGGSWPSESGSYYIVVHISAPVDTGPADNTASSIEYSVEDPDVNYGAFSLPAGGTIAMGTGITAETFSVENTGMDVGSQTVGWQAWISTSDVPGSVGEILVDEGSISVPFVPGPDSGPQTVSVDWSGIPAGIWYLIVTWTAADDLYPADNYLVSPPYSVDVPVHDYIITFVSDPVASANTGSPVSGTFTVQNLGPDDDSADPGFTWSVYASTDPLFNAGDALINSGSEPGQAVDDLGVDIDYSGGNWPTSSGDYYIVAVVYSPYDSDLPYAAAASSAASASITPMTDYDIENVLYDTSGTPGAQLSGTPYEFTIRELSGIEGTRKVYYSVYASSDTILDGPDPVLKEGSVKASDIGGGGSTAIGFDDAGITWPIFPAHYYIIVTLNAADDANSGNNISISGPVTVPDVFSEVDDNGTNDYNDGYYDVGPPVKTPTAKFHDLDADLQAGSLRPNELIHVSGIMDPQGEYDTYGFTPEAATNSVLIRAEWTSGVDDIDLFLWEYDGSKWVTSISIKTTLDTEGNISADNLVAGRKYYIGVNFWLGGIGTDTGGDPYTLIIKGLP